MCLNLSGNHVKISAKKIFCWEKSTINYRSSVKNQTYSFSMSMQCSDQFKITKVVDNNKCKVKYIFCVADERSSNKNKFNVIDVLQSDESTQLCLCLITIILQNQIMTNLIVS